MFKKIRILYSDNAYNCKRIKKILLRYNCIKLITHFRKIQHDTNTILEKEGLKSRFSIERVNNILKQNKSIKIRYD